MMFLVDQKHRARGAYPLLAVALLASSSTVWAQGPPAAQVRYSVAKEQSVRRSLTLSGTVEPRTATIVAASVEGQVRDFPAKEGMRVNQGQVLARLDTIPLELRRNVQRANLKESEARLKIAESRLGRARELYAAAVISQQQLDDSLTEFTALTGRVESLRAEIAAIEEDIARGTIRAPIAGIVVRERTEVGQWIAKGGPVVELLAMDTVEIRVDAPERYFADLRVGTPATATFESVPGLSVDGKVLAIIPEADRQARTFPVKILISNERGRVAAGMLAQVSFAAGESYKATVVPKDAVISRGPRKVLYRLNGDNTVEEVAVEIGTGVGSWIEVRGPVRAGDKVVTRGNERLFPGQPVQATPLEAQRP